MTSFEEYKKSLYERALSTFGEHRQIVVSIEEMSELQKELCKHLRGIGKIDNIVEETADVEIMIEQIKGIFNISDDTMRDVKERKLARLAHKIENLED